MMKMMKPSDYNYTVQKGDLMLCVNGISGSMLALKADEYALFQQLLIDVHLQKKYPRLVERMANGRFLVEDKAEDLEILRERFRASMGNDSSFSLTVNPTMDCNFKCWYCYETHAKSKMSDETQRRIKRLICRKYENPFLKNFSLGWFGGEPLLYFDEVVYPISKYALQLAESHQVKLFNSMTTNGYLFTDKMIERCNEIDLHSFQITIDGDRTIHNRVRHQNGSPSFDRILDNCIALLQSSPEMRIRLRVNYTSHSIVGKNYAEILSVVPEDHRPQMLVQFQRVWQTYEREGSDELVKQSLAENKRFLVEAGFKVSRNIQFAPYKGNICYGDKPTYVNVNFDGFVYRCTAQDYQSKNALGYIDEEGEIVWTRDDFRVLDEKPSFENERCLGCRFLPLCGGPCFNKRLQMLTNGGTFCSLEKMDTDIETYLIETYDAIHKTPAL
jgi:uncharacterized protein